MPAHRGLPPADPRRRARAARARAAVRGAGNAGEAFYGAAAKKLVHWYCTEKGAWLRDSDAGWIGWRKAWAPAALAGAAWTPFDVVLDDFAPLRARVPRAAPDRARDRRRPSQTTAVIDDGHDWVRDGDGWCPEISRAIKYRDVAVEASISAAALLSLRVRPLRILMLSNTHQELFVWTLGCARLGAVYSACAPGLAPLSVAKRMTGLDATLVLTDGIEQPHALAAIAVLEPHERVPRVAAFTTDLDGKRGLTETQFVPKRPARAAALLLASAASTPSTFLSTTVGIRPVPVEANYPLFVLYTSGSTGKPKGVVHCHGYVSGLLLTLQGNFDAVPGNDVMMVAATPGWITGQSYMIHGTLAMGLTSVITNSSPLSPFATRFAAVLQRYAVAIFKAGVAFIKTFAASGKDAELATYDLSALRVATFCAEPTAPRVQLYAMQSLVPNYLNSYWATEHGGMRRGAMLEEALDDQVGDIVITAPYPYLARTLWGDPERAGTAAWVGDLERFEKTYFCASAALRFAIGDRATKVGGAACDKYLLLGRSDDVINRNGHRLSTGEIEAQNLQTLKNPEAVADLDRVLREWRGGGDGAAAGVDARVVFSEAVLDLLGTALDGGAPLMASGITSVMTAGLLRRVSGDLHTSLSLATLFDRPTIDGLAALFDGPAPAGGGAAAARGVFAEAVLDLLGTAIDEDATLMASGITSVMMAGFLRRVSADLSTSLSLATLFDRPTIADLAGLFEDEAVGPILTSGGGGAAAASYAASHFSFLLPGGATSFDALSCILLNASTTPGFIPLERWIPRAAPLASYGSFAGPDRFFCVGTSPLEAAKMDPQQRWILERGAASLETFEDAGVVVAIQGSSSGVFVEERNRDPAARAAPAFRSTSFALSVASGRPSYVLGLTLFCASVDTACSSTLTALSVAVACGDAPMLVVGVQVLEERFSHLFFDAGMLSNRGRCHTWDARADGYARAEGVGAEVLERGGDGGTVVGDVKVAQDGRSLSLTAPNGASQKRLLSGVRTVGGGDRLEAHGTGTALGDPVESGAAVGALGKGGVDFGGIKANTAHLEAAAAAAGLLVLCGGGSVPATRRAGAAPQRAPRAHPAPSPTAPCTAARAASLAGARRSFTGRRRRGDPVLPAVISTNGATVSMVVNAVIADHVVGGSALFPGVGYVEIAASDVCRSGAGDAVVTDVKFIRPCILGAGSAMLYERTADGGFEVSSRGEGDASFRARAPGALDDGGAATPRVDDDDAPLFRMAHIAPAASFFATLPAPHAARPSTPATDATFVPASLGLCLVRAAPSTTSTVVARASVILDAAKEQRFGASLRAPGGTEMDYHRLTYRALPAKKRAAAAAAAASPSEPRYDFSWTVPMDYATRAEPVRLHVVARWNGDGSVYLATRPTARSLARVVEVGGAAPGSLTLGGVAPSCGITIASDAWRYRLGAIADVLGKLAARTARPTRSPRRVRGDGLRRPGRRAAGHGPARRERGGASVYRIRAGHPKFDNPLRSIARARPDGGAAAPLAEARKSFVVVDGGEAGLATAPGAPVWQRLDVAGGAVRWAAEHPYEDGDGTSYVVHWVPAMAFDGTVGTSRAGDVIDTELPSTLVFDHPSVAAIATAFAPASPLVADVAEAAPAAAAVAAAPRGAAAPPPRGARVDFVNVVSATTASLLGTLVDKDASLMSAGLDSIGATELARLGAISTELPSTLVFDHPSVAAIATAFAPAASALVADDAGAGDETANANMAALVALGVATNSTTPPTLWADDGSSAGYGCFLAGGPAFENVGAFGVSAREAGELCAGTGWLLEATYATLHGNLREANCRAALMNDATGLYVAAGGYFMTARINNTEDGPRRPSVYTGTALGFSVTSGRASYALGMTGPCLSLDTACSSSLVAFHVGAAALRADDDRGRCHTFDLRADGYCRGEGCTSVLLDGSSDDTCGVASRSSAVQQDGPSASMTAPNGSSQKRLILATGHAADGGLEAHGTGTALGDPIEVGAAVGALCKDADGKVVHAIQCASLKANMGHLESNAAGAGLAALLLSRMALSLTPPNNQLRTLNTHLAQYVAAGAFRMPLEVDGGRATLAALACRLSSFGFSGTIAHGLSVYTTTGSPPDAPSLKSAPSVFRAAAPVASDASRAFGVPGAPLLTQADTTFRLLPRVHATIADHVVNGAALFPGVGYDIEFMCSRSDDGGFDVSSRAGAAGAFASHARSALGDGASSAPVLSSSSTLSLGNGFGGVSRRGFFAPSPPAAPKAEASSASGDASFIPAAFGLVTVRGIAAHTGAAFATLTSTLNTASEQRYDTALKGGGVRLDVRRMTLRGMARQSGVAPASSSELPIFTFGWVPTAPAARDAEGVQVTVIARWNGDGSVFLATPRPRGPSRVVEITGASSGSMTIGGAAPSCSITISPDAWRYRLGAIADVLGQLATSSGASYQVAASGLGLAGVVLPGAGEEASPTFGPVMTWSPRASSHAFSVVEANCQEYSKLMVGLLSVDKERVISLSLLVSVRAAPSSLRASALALQAPAFPLKPSDGLSVSVAQAGARLAMVQCGGEGPTVERIHALSRRTPKSASPALSQSFVVVKDGEAGLAKTTSEPIWKRLGLVGGAVRWASEAPGDETSCLGSSTATSSFDGTVASLRMPRLAPKTRTRAVAAKAAPAPGPRPAAGARAPVAVAAPGAATSDAFVHLVAATAAALVGTLLPADASLMSAGLDSIGATDLAQSLGNVLSVDMPSTLVFDHPSIAAIAAAFAPAASPVAAAIDAAPAAAAAAPPAKRAAPQPRAVPRVDFVHVVAATAAALVGTLLPADASLMSAGLDSIGATDLAQSLGSALSADMPSTLVFDHPSISAIAAAFAPAAASAADAAEGDDDEPAYGAYDRVDAAAAPAGVAPAEARGRGLDPSIGYILEATYATLHGSGDAANCRAALTNDATGLYVGAGGLIVSSAVSTTDLPPTRKLSVYQGTSQACSVASGRASFVLGLTGPCMSIDTACSSSLCAFHVAASALRNDECPRAAVTGVSVLIYQTSNAFATAGMLSDRGRCHTFDLRADGYCRGEGCASFLLDGSSDEACGRRLLLAAGSPGDTGVEAHGTGTALGDPIEVGAAVGALCKDADGKLVHTIQCASLKANMGHLESNAAGAGLAALLLSRMALSLTPPNNQLRTLNTHLAQYVAAGAFRMPLEVDGGRATLAALACRLSSFGFSGTIAHGLFVHSTTGPAPVAATLASAPSLFRAAEPVLQDSYHAFAEPVLNGPYQVPQPLPANRAFALLPRVHATLAEHVVNGVALFPGVGYVEIAAASVAARGFDEEAALLDLTFVRPCVLTADIEFMCSRSDDGGFEVLSRAGKAGAFASHARGGILEDATPQPALSSHAAPPINDVAPARRGFFGTLPAGAPLTKSKTQGDTSFIPAVFGLVAVQGVSARASARSSPRPRLSTATEQGFDACLQGRMLMRRCKLRGMARQSGVAPASSSELPIFTFGWVPAAPAARDAEGVQVTVIARWNGDGSAFLATPRPRGPSRVVEITGASSGSMTIGGAAPSCSITISPDAWRYRLGAIADVLGQLATSSGASYQANCQEYSKLMVGLLSVDKERVISLSLLVSVRGGASSAAGALRASALALRGGTSSFRSPSPGGARLTMVQCGQDVPIVERIHALSRRTPKSASPALSQSFVVVKDGEAGLAKTTSDPIWKRLGLVGGAVRWASEAPGDETSCLGSSTATSSFDGTVASLRMPRLAPKTRARSRQGAPALDAAAPARAPVAVASRPSSAASAGFELSVASITKSLLAAPAPSRRQRRARGGASAGFELAVASIAKSLLGTLVDGGASLMAAGLDSVSSTDLAQALGGVLDTELPSTLVFDHPSMAAIADAFAPAEGDDGDGRADDAAAAPSPPRRRGRRGRRRGPTSPASALRDDHARRAAAGRSLGSSRRGLTATSRRPVSRWRAAAATWAAEKPSEASRYGAFAVEGEVRVELSSFGLSKVEARALDPQMSLALHHMAMALPSDRAQLAGSGIGVYVGAGSWISGSGLKGAYVIKASVYTGTSLSLSVVSGRASYILGLTGPCLSLDTACSSYLVAAHLATSAMTLGECATAVATSVGFLQSDVTFAFSAAGMLSLNGRCHTFDGRADGYCRGEGTAAYVFEEGGLHGVVEGVAVRQDGASASLTAPNGASQRKLLSVVAGPRPRVPCLEAHGTGTALGDPIEMGREPVFFHLGLPRSPQGETKATPILVEGTFSRAAYAVFAEHVVMSASADIVLEGIQLLRPCQMREGSEARFRFASNLDQTYELSSFQDIAGDFKTHTKGHEADAEAAENYRTYALNSAFKAKGPRPAGAGRLGAAAQQKPMVPAGARAIVPSRRLLNKVITRDRSFHFTASWVGLCIPQKTATEQTLSASILKSLVDGDDPEISFRMHRLKLREISGDQAKGAGPGGSLPPIAEGQGDASVPARAAPVYDVVLADKAVDRSARADDARSRRRKARAARGRRPGARGAPGARGRARRRTLGTLRVRAVASTAGARVAAHRPAERPRTSRPACSRTGPAPPPSACGPRRRARRRRPRLVREPRRGRGAREDAATPRAAVLDDIPAKAKSPRGMTKTKSLLASSSHALDMLAGASRRRRSSRTRRGGATRSPRLKANLEEKLGMPLSKHEAIIDAITRKIEATLGKFGARAMGGGMRKRFATRFRDALMIKYKIDLPEGFLETWPTVVDVASELERRTRTAPPPKQSSKGIARSLCAIAARLAVLARGVARARAAAAVAARRRRAGDDAADARRGANPRRGLRPAPPGLPAARPTPASFVARRAAGGRGRRPSASLGGALLASPLAPRRPRRQGRGRGRVARQNSPKSLPKPAAEAVAKPAKPQRRNSKPAMTPAKESQALRKAALTTIERCVMDVVGTVVGEDAPLMENGLDSLGSSELVGAVARHLVKLTQPDAESDDELSDMDEADFDDDAPGGHLRAAKAVAVLPAFCFTLPGPHASAKNLFEFVGRGLAANASTPAALWVADGTPAGYGSFVRLGAFFDVVGSFGVSRREASELDHSISLVLEASYGALRGNHAGDKQCRSALMNDPCGLFMGAGGFVMSAAINTTGLPPPKTASVYAGTSVALSVVSGRVSYVLGLTGPCVALDTAARASATGIGLLIAMTTFAFSAAGMLSGRGRCHTFDLRADGYCRGEGCGSYVLEGDGDTGTVANAGSAIRQDGPSASMTAPNGSSQRRLLLAAGAAADTGLEAHGTGTALGDPIEVGAAVGAFCKDDAGKLAHKIQCASLKANMGHLEPSAAAAGLASLLLTRLARGLTPPNNQLRRLNAHLAQHLAGPFFAPQELLGDYLAAAAASCRLSSFGFSGTIAHGAFARGGRAAARRRGRGAVALPRRRARPSSSRVRHTLRDHVAHGRELFPGVGYVEIAASMLLARGYEEETDILDLNFTRPCALADGLEFLCAGAADGTFDVASRAGAGAFASHARGRLGDDGMAEPLATPSFMPSLEGAGGASRVGFFAAPAARAPKGRAPRGAKFIPAVFSRTSLRAGPDASAIVACSSCTLNSAAQQDFDAALRGRLQMRGTLRAIGGAAADDAPAAVAELPNFTFAWTAMAPARRPEGVRMHVVALERRRERLPRGAPAAGPSRVVEITGASSGSMTIGGAAPSCGITISPDAWRYRPARSPTSSGSSRRGIAGLRPRDDVVAAASRAFSVVEANCQEYSKLMVGLLSVDKERVISLSLLVSVRGGASSAAGALRASALALRAGTSKLSVSVARAGARLTMVQCGQDAPIVERIHALGRRAPKSASPALSQSFVVVKDGEAGLTKTTSDPIWKRLGLVGGAVRWVSEAPGDTTSCLGSSTATSSFDGTVASLRMPRLAPKTRKRAVAAKAAPAPGPRPAAGARAPVAAKRSSASAGLELSVASILKNLLGTLADGDASLMSAGLDSVSATDFANSLAGILETELPSTLVFDHPSMSSITAAFSPAPRRTRPPRPAAARAPRGRGSRAVAAPRRRAGGSASFEASVSSILKNLLGTLVDGDASLMSAGLDSVSATDFANSLAGILDTELPSTLVFDHPSLASIAAAFAPDADGGDEGDDGDAYDDGEYADYGDEVAYVAAAAARGTQLRPASQAFLFPGALASVGALRATTYGAMCASSAIAYDGAAFGISTAEARSMDAQMGLVLEAAAEALAGVGPRADLRNALIGFFLGADGELVSEFSGNAGARSVAGAGAYAGTSKALSVASGRAPYVLGLTGPCTSMGTACSSSLVALHGARSAVVLDECDRSAVVGVGILTAAVTASFAAAGMLSPLGRCHTLDRGADGYCRGEGVAAVVVDRRLIDAVPGAEAHAVFVLEMHGTGTALGDPIEVGAASGAVAPRGAATATSIKANAGHLEAVAAATGLFALVHAALDASLVCANARLLRLNAHLRSVVASAKRRGAPDATFLEASSYGVASETLVLYAGPDVEVRQRGLARFAPLRPAAFSLETTKALDALVAAPKEIVAADSRALVDSRDAAWTALACRAVAELVASVTLVVDGAFGRAPRPDANLAIFARRAPLPSARFALALVFDRPAGSPRRAGRP
ncbi:delta-3,5-delta-2,4-dienoyl-CoA isomerase [Aureococcus anophagefferens]|nr:delta-3,5-delta-2,4-dienoyl-CoA isomerase [Aureococcus anophagefferens]